MLSIGWVMFWKAVVIAVWVAICEAWSAFKAKRASNGIPLRLDRKTGAYTPDDWPQKVDRYVKFAGNVAMYSLLALGAALSLYLYLTP